MENATLRGPLRRGVTTRSHFNSSLRVAEVGVCRVCPDQGNNVLGRAQLMAFEAWNAE